MVTEFTAGVEWGEAADAVDAGQFRGFPDLARFPLGYDRELFYSPLTRAAHTLPAVAVALVQHCRTFATLEEHASRIGLPRPPGPEIVVRGRPLAKRREAAHRPDRPGLDPVDPPPHRRGQTPHAV
jgi:hypothetical protein